MHANSKDLPERTVSDKVLKDRPYEITLNPKYVGYQRGSARMLNKIFDKIGSGTKANVNEVLTQELHKPVFKKIRKKKTVCYV